jgi:hypothetical protein
MGYILTNTINGDNKYFENIEDIEVCVLKVLKAGWCLDKIALAKELNFKVAFKIKVEVEGNEEQGFTEYTDMICRPEVTD